MLIKEYRIPLPLSVEEYKIAQLYMIAKKSREESKDIGSGIEILINEPYESGPGGSGQYTRKVYHVGNHLPGWFKSLLPKSALSVEEEAWNAYPYTKTRYTCPFVEKFFIEIETVYRSDCGDQDNVFSLSGVDLRNRAVDLIDVVKDHADCCKEEDPTIFVSQKTGRGPLSENWLVDYATNKMKGKHKDMMCAYKLCRVEFRYWGMQSKLEKYIHDVALRKTMIQAHIQAWVWQDEWYGLTMNDIRHIEKQTQEALRQKMNIDKTDSSANGQGDNFHQTFGSIEKSEHDLELSPNVIKRNVHVSDASPSKGGNDELMKNTDKVARTNWANIISHDSDSEQSTVLTDDEFFDCQEDMAYDGKGLVKWSSLDLLTEEDGDSIALSDVQADDSIFSSSYLKRTASETSRSKSNSRLSCPNSPTPSAVDESHTKRCKTTSLLIVFHAGCVLDSIADGNAKKSDITTFRYSFENVMRQHFPSMLGRVAFRLLSCPAIAANTLSILSSVNPYSFDVSPSVDGAHITHDSLPIGAIPILATVCSQYDSIVNKVMEAANCIYKDFINSDDGCGFNGNVYFVGDSMGSLVAYDVLCKGEVVKVASSPSPNHSLATAFDDKVELGKGSSTCDHGENVKLQFQVNELFTFGSPLSLVLAYRKMRNDNGWNIQRPCVQQVYNLFHPTDPVSSRLEPLISARFSLLPPVNIPRYQKYPLGNGLPYHLLEVVQTNSQIFYDPGTTVAAAVGNSMQIRRLSEASLVSGSSGITDPLPVHVINALSRKWWGNKRMDYALYCPEGLSNFPANSLPHLFHASYWESCDVIAFMLRQIGGFDMLPNAKAEDTDSGLFVPRQPREKWIRKRTSVKLNKLKNITCNHRANDVIVRDGAPQTLVARFMYGSYDVITLTGERVDIYVMPDNSIGEWTYLSTQVTDKTGRVSYTIPEDKALPFGIHHVKIVVRGDHTSVDFQLAVVPPQTECVVFSIDGSFTASVSVTGRDPKVRAGAVDVVRQWQELGYLILYISARPDMQQQLVLSWLVKHNFPYGLVVFADRFSTDPLGYKTMYLKNLKQEHGLIICAAYGSNKDVTVYTSVGLKANEIFIVGRLSKKYQSLATMLCDGYASHLNTLLSHGGPRAAKGNARMVLFSQGCFAHNTSIRRRRSVKRTTSFPLATTTTTTTSQIVTNTSDID